MFDKKFKIYTGAFALLSLFFYAKSVLAYDMIELRNQLKTKFGLPGIEMNVNFNASGTDVTADSYLDPELQMKAGGAQIKYTVFVIDEVLNIAERDAVEGIGGLYIVRTGAADEPQTLSNMVKTTCVNNWKSFKNYKMDYEFYKNEKECDSDSITPKSMHSVYGPDNECSSESIIFDRDNNLEYRIEYIQNEAIKKVAEPVR